MADIKNEKEVELLKQQIAEQTERINDLKAEKELSNKSVLAKRTVVKINKKDYEIIGNARVGGLGAGQTYTKEDLQKSENVEIVRQMIAKGSGLIRLI
jgi:hypothetical protein